MVDCPYPLIKVFLRFSMAMPRIFFFFFPGHMPSKPYKKQATAVFQKPQSPRLHPCNPPVVVVYSVVFIDVNTLQVLAVDSVVPWLLLAKVYG